MFTTNTGVAMNDYERSYAKPAYTPHASGLREAFHVQDGETFRAEMDGGGDPAPPDGWKPRDPVSLLKFRGGVTATQWEVARYLVPDGELRETATTRSCRLRSALLERADAFVEVEERSFNWLVRVAIEAYLDQTKTVYVQDVKTGDRIRFRQTDLASPADRGKPVVDHYGRALLSGWYDVQRAEHVISDAGMLEKVILDIGFPPGTRREFPRGMSVEKTVG